MKIYLASSWKNADAVNAWAHGLREAGYDVDAFCDDSTGRFVFSAKDNPRDISGLNAVEFLKDERSQKAFEEDKRWLDWADICILILPAGKSSHLEAGYAKGCGKKLLIWQDSFPEGDFDVMYGFADLITDNINDVFKYLRRVMAECAMVGRIVL